MLRIKKNDKVMIITGKDKGKMGKVLRVIPKEDRLVVENINVTKKAVRKSQKNPQGGVIQIESPIHRSNVMVVDRKTNKPTRFGISILKDGSKVRISKKSQEAL